jgi:hypothetical protein
VSAGTFFSKPEYPDREPARPKAVNPRTGKEQSWTRASNFASALDNPHALIKWSNRNAVMGMSRRPDLAAMALAGALRDDVAKVDETIAAAHATMATDANANLGTAAHAAITNAWSHPEQPVPEPYVPLVKAFAAALKEHELKIVAAAGKVMNLAYDSLGEFDLVLEEADGSIVIGDMKSGKLDHAKRKFAVQLAMYDGAEYEVKANGSVVPVQWNLAHSHGVLLHLDLENSTVSVYRIDLRIGRYGAGLAEQIRQWHTLDPLSPYVSPIVPRKASVLTEAENPQELDRLNGLPEPTTEQVLQQIEDADARGVVLESDGSIPEDTPEQSTSERFDERGRSATDVRFDELMGLDKAPLQMLLKKTFGWTDDAHNRRWLARAVIALENGMTGRDVVKYAASKDDGAPMTVPEAAQAVAQADAARAAGPSSATLLTAIAGANSEGAIEALRKDLVERRGDQAWTDELVSAARARVLELLSASGNAVGDAARTLAQVKSASSKEELKDIWDRVTMGNTVPEKWTDELTNAGLNRLDELAKATPPPPANPFA